MFIPRLVSIIQRRVEYSYVPSAVPPQFCRCVSTHWTGEAWKWFRAADVVTTVITIADAVTRSVHRE
jgi:hypothetical protein